MGAVARPGTGSRPDDGEMVREDVLGAKGRGDTGVGGASGAGGIGGRTIVAGLEVGSGTEGGRGGSTMVFTPWSGETDASCGALPSSMLLVCVFWRAASACSRKISSVKGSA